jgi:hypothetical protein
MRVCTVPMFPNPSSSRANCPPSGDHRSGAPEARMESWQQSLRETQDASQPELAGATWSAPPLLMPSDRSMVFVAREPK